MIELPDVPMMNEDDKGRFVKHTRSLLEGGEDVVIVTFGDSITEGYAVRHGFPYFWKGMLESKYSDSKIKLHNEGICGDTTLDGMARVAWAVIPNRPDLVTINFGINDAAFGIHIDEFKDNFAEIVERIQAECGSEILLLSSQPLLTPSFNKLVTRYYKAVEEVAQITGTGFVDVYSAWMRRVADGTPLESMIIDGLDHPNEAGYLVIAEELMTWF